MNGVIVLMLRAMVRGDYEREEYERVSGVFVGAPDGSSASTRRDAPTLPRSYRGLWSSFTLLFSFLFLSCGYWLEC